MRVSEDNADLIKQRLWVVEQEILDEFHRVCVENGLRYSLAYGTLLGAVRHKGFIPWDDDIDVMMPREDYDRLISIWDQVSSERFILQTEENSEDSFNNFSKIRKNNTTFIMLEEEKTRKFHKGIYVDVFPMVRQASGGFWRKIQYALFMINLLYNRGYTSGHRGFMGIAEKFLLTIVPKKSYRKISLWAMNRAKRWQKNVNGKWISPCTFIDCSRLYSKSLFDNLNEIEFQGKLYESFSDYDGFLSVRYGDYMKLPPENERVWKHHPTFVDFDRNYEDIMMVDKLK